MGRWRAREAGLPALDLAPYRLIDAGTFLARADIIKPTSEAMRRTERACLGVAALLLALIVAKTGGAL